MSFSINCEISKPDKLGSITGLSNTECSFLNFREQILRVCRNPDNFHDLFVTMDFGDLLTLDKLPSQEQYNELVGASKYDKSAKITLIQIRTYVKSEYEKRLKFVKGKVIEDILNSKVDTVREVPRTPPRPNQNMGTDAENMNNENNMDNTQDDQDFTE